MFDDFQTTGLGQKIARALLAFDAWINSSLYESGQQARQRYDTFVAFMDRFHVSGWRKVGVELACETLTLGLAGAVLMLALAVPAFNETSDEDWLKKQDLAVVFLDRYGEEVGRRGIKHDDSLPLEQVPDFLIQAVLATEDRRFFEHYGIDPIGTLRAFTVNARSSGVVQGGSTITQQLAKNLFLSNERSIERKVKEAFLALWLETRLTKNEILKLYLDRAYMGGGAFGVQAAADFYFGKSLREINLAEAAMLAGLFKAPTKFAPHVNLPAARARANDVLQNLVDSGFMTEGQVFIARKNPATPVDRHRAASPDWYLDWAFEEVKKLAQAGKFGDDRVLTVRTALDSGIQHQSEKVLEDNLRQFGKQYRVKQGAIVVLEPNGAVRAIVGGRDYGASQFNRATDALRQPGSSFKPYVYLAALLTNKFKPSTIVTDGPVCIGNWCPKNYGGGYAGSMPLISALTRSINTIAVKLSIAIGDGSPKAGRAKIVELARRMGITSPLTDTPSLPIGAGEVTPLEHANAYAVFANGGKRAPAFAIVDVHNSRGDLIYHHDAEAAMTQVVPPAKIAEMNTMLMSVVENGTGRRAILPGIKVGGKTGTTNGYKDAWFMGFTGNYVGAVWYGNDEPTSMNNMTGGTLPAQTWHDVMEFAHQGIELKPLYSAPPPSPEAIAAALSRGSGQGTALGQPQRPVTLSRKSTETLGALENLLRTSAERQRKVDATPVHDDGTMLRLGSAKPPQMLTR
ncbi:MULTISPECIES: PBP1A family penicillin-binding protein [unclassified Beijerinckia]|uniref:transglycosylase domain-containing protein n=1 Tax=unclassified Beijerinckia TaxID=2638183 RepID=UPI00089805BE|nr:MULTISPECIES: PBP1A family penicillin-binding protein [unclassified Beijerinckia]MDH7796351.1 penicillin-binding protein 1A [Beijerinckia sp. GAS462]SEC41322.1 penicillin-binding protein 1A [Beijerinckia sp. 28-YEA-48]